MPAPRNSQKRRWSGHRSNISSKRTSSTSSTQSGARSVGTAPSRRSSGSSLQGRGYHRVSRDASVRPTSSVGTHTYADEARSGTDAVSGAAREEYPDVELLSEIIMAVNLTDRGAIGCAYYVAQTETLYFMEDVQMGDAEMVDSCKHFLESNEGRKS